MPFVAKLKSTGKRVDITRLEHPRRELDAADVICQLCDAPMIIKAGLIVSAHFAHKAGAPCSDLYASHPESADHRLGKLVIAGQLRTEMAEYSDAAIEYEVPIPEVRRIADVMVIFPNGWRVAHECQLAGITTRQLEERTEDYLHAGVDVVWWLGKTANTPNNRAWCIERQGFSLELYFGLGFGGRILSDMPREDSNPTADLGVWRDGREVGVVS